MRCFGAKRLQGFIIAGWIFVAVGSVFLSPDLVKVSSAATGDAANGKLLFEKRCTGCHALDNNKEGPRLRGVYGRKAGSVPDFNYSDQLRTLKFTWDEASLDKWLTNPDAVAPDNDMAFHVSNPQERADIIQFLRLDSGK